MLLSKTFSEGCSFYDIVLNVYLSLNLIPKFIIDNNIIDMNVLTKTGQTFVFDSAYIDDEFMSNQVVRNDYQFCTGQLFVSTAIQGNYLLIESSEILSSESNNLFLI